MNHHSQNPEDYLDQFGLTEFRPGQRDVIDAVLAGEHCLCIMPTGGGKSLCYQLPSVMRAGVTLVVSPLIALMKDQVDQLQQMGIAASFINSSLSMAEASDRMDRMVADDFDLMYIAPERFRSPRFMEALHQTNVQLLAIDEAHCISEWGHDFRHDYTRLGKFRQQMGHPQTIALTATATSDVRDDVIKQLEVESPQVFIAGFARPNLNYQVEPYVSAFEKREALVEYLNKTAGTGIIYASTRKGCDEIAEQISEETNKRIVVYHAGLVGEQRKAVQECFMSGQADVVVATNAFGMGINKADVRFVLHFNLPGTLEAYYQEAGRAGRDGLPSECVLMYSASDRYIQEFFIDNANPPPEAIAAVYEFLRHHPADPIELTLDDLKSELGLSIGAEGIGVCERLLEKAGVLERLEPNRNMAIVRINSELTSLVDLLPKTSKNKRRVLQKIEKHVGSRRYENVYFRPHEFINALEMTPTAFSKAIRELTSLEAFDFVPPFRGRAVRMIRRDLEFTELNLDFAGLQARRDSNYEKLEQMVAYAQTTGCRQEQILAYFGEKATRACGNCDNCETYRYAASTSATSSNPAAMPEDDSGVVETVRIILSGVARSRSRFGKSIIAAMLCGSQASKVKKWKLDELSTFGLLGHLRQTDVSTIIDAMVRARLLDQNNVDKFRPVLLLTDYGLEVMRGTSPLRSFRLPGNVLDLISRPESPKSAVRNNDQPSEPASDGKSKIDDSEDLSHVEAGDCSDGSGVTSAGSRIRTDVSHPVMPEMNANLAAGIQQDATVDAASPVYYWTWRLLQDGYSWNECLVIRQINTETAVDHLNQADDAGWEVDPNWVLSDEEFHSIGKLNPQQLDGVAASLMQRAQLFAKWKKRSNSE